MQRLGGQVIPITGIQYSSVSKGESLPDTVRTMEAYSDAIVMRHPTRGSAAEAASYLRIPLINAGDGDGEHPTQALLDLFTMFEELDDLNGRHIMLLGDLKYGRTVHALVQLLAHFKVRIDFVAPFSLSMPDEYLSLLTQKGIPFRQHVSPEEALGYMDVIYATRIQKERFVDQAEYERLKDVFVINAETMAKAKPGMVLMHPLPRVNEIAPEVDADPRAAYFRQVRNGLYVRMALLAMVLGKA
jgi:aspartate carbamoyltransferase